MSAQEKSEVLTRVEETPVGKTEATRPTAGAQEHLLPVAGPCTAREARQLYRQYPDSLE